MVQEERVMQPTPVFRLLTTKCAALDTEKIAGQFVLWI